MVRVIEPRIEQALQLLGPEFHVVRTEELAKLRKISHASAQRIFQHLLQGNKNTHVKFSPSGAMARKVMRDCWAINDHGQETMHWPKNADAAYREWLYVVCDKLDGAGRKEALEALAYVFWPFSFRGDSVVQLAEDKHAWEELAFHVIASVTAVVHDPSITTRRMVKNAILSIYQQDIAKRTLEALQRSREPWWPDPDDRLDFNSREHGYDWAVTHLKSLAQAAFDPKNIVAPLDNAEMTSGAVTILGQLAASGLAESVDVPVLMMCLAVLDGLAPHVPEEAVKDASIVRGRLKHRITFIYSQFGMIPPRMAATLRRDPYAERLVKMAKEKVET